MAAVSHSVAVIDGLTAAIERIPSTRATTRKTEYLPSQETQHQVEEGLNVVENWNATNDFICYGRQGELATS